MIRTNLHVNSANPYKTSVLRSFQGEHLDCQLENMNFWTLLGFPKTVLQDLDATKRFYQIGKLKLDSQGRPDLASSKLSRRQIQVNTTSNSTQPRPVQDEAPIIRMHSTFNYQNYLRYLKYLTIMPE